MRPRARLRFSAHTMLIIPSIPLPQQGLFYKKITFSTHFAGFQSFRHSSFSNILRRFYISYFKPCHSASSSIASRTVSAEKRNTPLPVAPCDCIIAHAASHKSDFQGFSGDFCTKNAPPSQKWEGGAWQVRLFSGAQWAAAYSGTTRPGCGASSARDFS